MKYRVFVQDIGITGFSGVSDIVAKSPSKAIKSFAKPKFTNTWYGRKLIAIPHNKKELWPNGLTGIVPKEALSYK